MDKRDFILDLAKNNHLFGHDLDRCMNMAMLYARE